MKLQLPKGTRDFKPEEKIVRQWIVDSVRSSFEQYGFVPLETPLIERFEVLSAKYAGGAEILKETFTFEDQGNRKLGLRYDLTVPLARFVGSNPDLKMPFKRYQIERVFRDGPIKTGRYREFWQCDADIVGCKFVTAERELITLAQDVFKTLDLDCVIEVNDRRILDGILQELGVKKDKWVDVILTIDKLKKVELSAIKKELKGKGLDDEGIAKLLSVFQLKGSNKEKLSSLKKVITNDIGKEGLASIEELLSLVKGKNIEFNVSLARGLSYYTGTIYEIFAKEGPIKSSLGSGGRYDEMIGGFLGGSRDVAAVGISFGLEPILETLKGLKKIEMRKSLAQVYVIPIGTTKECLSIVDKLRKEGLDVDIDLMQRSISKNLNYANSLGIPFVAVVGEDELKQDKVKLKNMKTGKEEMISISQVTKKVTN